MKRTTTEAATGWSTVGDQYETREIRRLLSESGAKLLRTTGRGSEVWELPNGAKFFATLHTGDYRALKNNLAELRRALGPEPTKAPPAAPKKEPEPMTVIPMKQPPSEATKKMAAAIENMMTRSVGMLEERRGDSVLALVRKADVLDMCKNIAANLAEMTVEHSRDLVHLVTIQERTLIAERIDNAATALLQSETDDLGRRMNELAAAVLRTMARNIRDLRDAAIAAADSPKS